MAMPVNDRLVNEGGALYYSAEWHRCIESHLAWLRALPSNRLLTIEPGIAYKYEGDLSGLLQASRFRPEHHWVIMRMNEMTSPTQYRHDQLSLVIPDLEAVEGLRAVFGTANKKFT